MTSHRVRQDGQGSRTGAYHSDTMRPERAPGARHPITVRYHRAVRAVRLLTLLLVATIAAGPTLLDRCLISCHDESKSDAVPACHEHVAQPGDGLSVHAVDACGHDHDGSPADTVTDARGNAVRHADLVASTAAVSHAEPPLSGGAVFQLRIAWRPPSASPVLTALRL